MIPIRRLDHAVLFVADLQRSVDFYTQIFPFEVIAREMDGGAVFLRLDGSPRHHDLGLFGLGAAARPFRPGTVGLYHLAWQVDSIGDLVHARDTLAACGSLTGQSSHGATKSIYGRDPDGNEFEVMWALPRDQWGSYANQAPVEFLDLDAELARHGSGT